MKRCLALVLLALGAWQFASAETVCLIRVEGAIGPATATYIGRAIDVAAENQAECLVIQLDTPGGLLDSTKIIVQRMLASPVPTVVYVAPPGASAGSAGCFITLAADVAAMAPTTNIGAAHPVAIGGGGGGGDEQKMDDTMKQKLENYASSYIETIASKRHRNVEWAKSSVIESSAITAEKALEMNVIEIIADDLDDLRAQLDGREVGTRTLATADATVVEIEMTMRERVFQMIWRPEVMMILMLIAVYGIIGELSNPGAVVPGVVGAIAFVLLLYMASVLPINVAGFALIALAIALFIGEAFTPTFGVLTTGGIVCFFLGSLMLFEDAPLKLPLTFLIPATVVTALFFVFVVAKGLQAQFRPVKVGRETIVGRTVEAVTAIDGQTGKVFFEGEYWNAVSDTPVQAGEHVEIVAQDGLMVRVKPKNV
jgi:membrane-bound serine protease (ClpP class)